MIVKVLFMAFLAMSLSFGFGMQGVRAQISSTLSFAAQSEWEGVYATFRQCDPESGYCYMQRALSIYDCILMNQYRYEDPHFICKLGNVESVNPSRTNANEHTNCETGTYPSEIEIEIRGNVAFPTSSYYDFMCQKASNVSGCEKNIGFSLTRKEGEGIVFSSSKALDSITCETPNDERFAGTLSSFYPIVNGKQGNGAFDCTKEGLSIVERGICNNFYLLREDYSLNVVYDFIMDFANENLKQQIKSKQLAYLKTRNFLCIKEEELEGLEKCLFDSILKQQKVLKEAIKEIEVDSVRLESPSGEIRIYDMPNIEANVLYTAFENDTYRAYLAMKGQTSGFVKIAFKLIDSKRNPNNNTIVGYVRVQDMRMQN
ncbi:hypothetical protein [Helicobacter sp. MIT 14-3879]|uniref:hypothetical protein n=1 Tax=Helicobacter sp. MIT 14-3879 TaxID=2040649 RepID=UPI000E1F24C9|nr:hypothetical protein [Helicobacter sp. MIT 14-3879]RDU59290.1 hypothetical protein CQA44_11575 [Helicobacter sp. MIT 14-3879]